MTSNPVNHQATVWALTKDETDEGMPLRELDAHWGIDVDKSTTECGVVKHVVGAGILINEMLRQGDKSSQFPGRVLELRQNGCDAIRDFYLSERINQGKYYFLFKDVDFSQDTAKTKVSWVSHSCSIIVVNLDSHKGTIIEMRMMR